MSFISRLAEMFLLFCLLSFGAASPVIGQTWHQYPYSAGLLTFPQDEGRHNLAPIEWWYVNAEMKGLTTGKTYIFFVSYNKLFQRYSNLLVVEDQLIDGGVDTGITMATAGKLDVRFVASDHTDHFAQIPGKPFEYALDYQRGDYSLTCNLDATKPPHPLGGTGLVRQLPETSTYYYAQTRLLLEGEVETPSGTESVEGLGWIDRQWYEFGMSNSKYYGHTWFAIHLDNDVDIAAFQVKDEYGLIPYPLFDIVYSNGLYVHQDAFDAQPTDFWTDPTSGLEFPITWSLSEMTRQISLDLTALVPNQTTYSQTFGTFWEGGMSVSGWTLGQSVNGVAFVEVAYGPPADDDDDNDDNDTTDDETMDEDATDDDADNDSADDDATDDNAGDDDYRGSGGCGC